MRIFCHRLNLEGAYLRAGLDACGRNSSERCPPWRRPWLLLRSPLRSPSRFWLRLRFEPPRERRRRLSPGLRESCVAFDMLSVGSRCFRRPGAADSEKIRQCWKDLVLTGMAPTIRLFGAGGKLRSLRKETSPVCRNQPACAAAREAGVPVFLAAGRFHDPGNEG